MRTATTRTLAAVTGAVTLSVLAGPVPAAASPVGTPPARILVVTDTGVGNAALSPDGTVFNLVAPELHVYGPGTAGVAPPDKVITGLNAPSLSPPSFDPSAGLATAISQPEPAVVVIDPRQPAGSAVPVRTIVGPQTRIEAPTAVTWAPDGSLWVVDQDADGDPGRELLHFPPGADGDAVPDRVIVGGSTRLADLGGGPVLDSLPDGSVVVGAISLQSGVLVFGPAQNGNVAPARRLTPVLPGTSHAQYGAAADSRGRIYVAMADLDNDDWGTVAVYAAGATGAAAPVFELTGPASGLHTVLLPSVATDGGLLVGDVQLFDSNATGAQRLLEFAPLPYAPSAARKLRAKSSRTKVKFRWRHPADRGHATISRYLVTVTKGKRTVVRASVPGSKRKLVVARSRLPRGRVTLTVTAVNVAGPGAAAVKKFRRLGTGPGS